MDQTAAATGGIMAMLLPMAVFFVIIWFLMIRPEKKRREKHQEMLNNLKAGDSVITIGGIKGKIIKVKDDTIRLRVSSNVDIDMVKNSIASVEKPSASEDSTKESKKEKPEKAEEKTESEE